LLGFDHADAEDEAAMFALQRQLLDAFAEQESA
jgi:ssRNA-specific RNase YbeY (16S rRNA maturation enzyme)